MKQRRNATYAARLCKSSTGVLENSWDAAAIQNAKALNESKKPLARNALNAAKEKLSRKRVSGEKYFTRAINILHVNLRCGKSQLAKSARSVNHF